MGKVFSSAEDVLALIGTAKIHEVEVKDVGVFTLRVMTSAERDNWELSLLGADTDPNKLKNLRARLVAKSLVNGSGELIFKNGKADQLGELPANIIDVLFAKAQQINGLTEAEADVEDDLEDLVKKAES